MPEHDPMSGTTRSSRWLAQDGSLPLTLLATIIVASVAAVLVARVITGEQLTHRDKVFSNEIHVADAGVQQALFQISSNTALAATAVGGTATLTEVVGDLEYDVTVQRITNRDWRILSVASENGAAAGPDRSVLAVIQEKPFFYPGAFGDTLIALNGTSSRVDSYNSKQPSQTSATACQLTVDKCSWGTHAEFGTSNGSLGTNGSFDFDGNTTIRQGGAFLYDWASNPGAGQSESDPFGDRCDGNPCTYTYVATVPEPLDFDTPENMGFIDDKFVSGGACDDPTSDRWSIPDSTLAGGTTVIKGPGSGNNTTATVASYADHVGQAPGTSDVTDTGFTNFYCADFLEVKGDLNLGNTVDSDNPVVIFVKNGLSHTTPDKRIACRTPAGTECVSDPSPSANPPRPIADWLQVYVAGLSSSSSATSSNVQFKAGGRVSGVYYAPRSGCGSTGSGGLDIYGMIICRSMDNVGNWEFHFDDALGERGTGEWIVADWVEMDD